MIKSVRIILFFFIIFSLTVSASALEVVPSGECVGIKLYTDGPVVVGTTSVTAADGSEIDLSAGYGIEAGDILKRINGEEISSNEMLSSRLAENGGNEITLTIKRGSAEHDIKLTPVLTADGPRLGLWLRDSTAGLGTITCYIDNSFAALGHGICDADTGNIMPVGRGIIQVCTITAVSKSENGSPGAITGIINGNKLGTITQNTEHGLFGKLNASPDGKKMKVADKTEIKCGSAEILADVDGTGVKSYKIEIKRISPPIVGTKDMTIKITDDELISKTGGIVQGMSGAPIIQNNMLVGAVTHVFVNDSLYGYAITAEHMLKNMR